jgi:lipoate---protein ligase
MFVSLDHFPFPSDNLAWDEALVDSMDSFQPQQAVEVLRLWQFASPTIVLGRSGKAQDEVWLERCQREGVPVLRRASGGASIVAGPGCMMYSILIDYRERPDWKMLDRSHSAVMQNLKEAIVSTVAQFRASELSRHVDEIGWQGTCDLTLGNRKFSGNALRCKREFMIYHGTILLNMPLHWISDYLKSPPRQPNYRQNRDHGDFVCNLLPDAFQYVDEFQKIFISEMKRVWQADQEWASFPYAQEFENCFHRLRTTKYLDPNWHLER